MNILEWYRNKKEEERKERIVKMRCESLADLKFIRENDNEGLLHKRLFNMYNIDRLHTSSRMGSTSIDITMSDGYTISAYKYGYENAIRSAALRVHKRLRETILKI